MTVEQLSWRLRHLRHRAGLSQQALAQRALLSRNFVAQIERGESVPTVPVLRRLAEALAVTVAELLGEEAPAAPAAELVPVPLVADRIAAGPPALVSDRIDGYHPLPSSLLQRLGVDPSRAILVRLGKDQDSMADTIPPGSTVLLDLAPVQQIHPRQIYAVREDSGDGYGCAIKRVGLDPASRVLILLSDNPAHLPRAIRLRAGQSLSEIILGRVVWWIPAPSPP
ncbi:MAG: XRE family transcriptional regulator [Thermoanaerobaculum sp.]|nr:XRE family transcriptional regulator [Thermoanaerobaculum sp.]